jgi:MFS family permease
MSDSVVTHPVLPRRSFNLIFAASLTTTIGLNGMMSVMPSIGRKLGIADALVAMIFSLSGLLFSVCAPFWAKMSDKYGRKPLMITGTSGFILSMISCALVVIAGINRLVEPTTIFIFFLLARGLFGLFGSANGPSTQAYVAENTSPTTRTKAIAGLAGAANLGSILGPALAPLLILTPLGIAGPMVFFALAGCAVLLAIVFFLPESKYRPSLAPGLKSSHGECLKVIETPTVPLWRDARFFPFLIFGLAVFVCSAAQTQILGFLILDKVHSDPIAAQRFVATAMIAGAAAGMFAQWVIVRTFDMTPKSLMIVGAALAAAGNLINALQPNYITVIFGYASAAMGFAMARPGFTAGASLALTGKEQARAAGAIAALAGVNAVTNPLFVWLYGYSHWAPFAICTIVMSGMAVYVITSPILRGSAP